MIRPVLIALPFLLGGCATYYPPLYSAPTIADQPIAQSSSTLVKNCRSNDDGVLQTASCAEILQAVYSNSYEDSARWQDISQLPIIGAAAAAAWILLKNEDNAAKKAGKIGIGALTYTAARDQLFPKGMSEIFIQGHSALGCIIADKDYFTGAAAKEAFDALDVSLREVTLLAAATSALRYTTPSDAPASPELLKAAQSLADVAVAAANTQLRTSRQERAAFKFAASPFRKSVGDVAAWVASKGRVRPNASYGDLLKNMSSTPTTGTATTTTTNTAVPAIDGGVTLTLLRFQRAADPSNPPTSAQLIRMIGEASQLLSSKSIELQGNTPAYGARLLKVEKCATDLPPG